MTYQEIVEMVREVYENADARGIYEHIALQVNVTGEAAGIFYIEVANRQVSVEPYDYVDHDCLAIIDTQAAIDITEGRLTQREAQDMGLLRWEGNRDKLLQLTKIKLKKRHKKTS